MPFFLPQGTAQQQTLRSRLRPNFWPPQGIGGEAVGQFLLDRFPGATVAYSLRQLRTDYLGPAIRVKRTSDSTEQDIGFLENGDLDVPSMVLFVGEADGRVNLIYDQSGNDIHLDGETSNLQFPKVIIEGVLQSSNNLSSMFFDGIDDAMFSTNSLPTPAPNLFVFGVWQKTNLADNPENFNLLFPMINPNRVAVHAPFSTGEIIWDPGNNTTERLATAASFNDLLQHVYVFTKTEGTDRQIIKRDGIQLAQRTQNSPSTVLDKASIGSFRATFGSSEMQFQELVFYDTDRFSDIESIENNIINYWQRTITVVWVDDLNNTFVDDLNNTVVFDI